MFNKNISLYVVTLVIVVVLLIVVASNHKYYKFVTQIYSKLSRIPKLIIILISIMSLLGITHQLNYPSLPHQLKYPSLPHNKTAYIKTKNTSHKRLVSETTKKMVASKQQWKCGLCNKILDETYEVDHIIPLYKGGSNDISNLMALDPICHRKKTNADRLGFSVDL